MICLILSVNLTNLKTVIDFKYNHISLNEISLTLASENGNDDSKRA